MVSLLQVVLLILCLLNLAMIARFYRRALKDKISLGKELIQTRLKPFQLKEMMRDRGKRSSSSSSDFDEHDATAIRQGFTAALRIDPLASFDTLGDAERIQAKGAVLFQQILYNHQIGSCIKGETKVKLYRLPYTHKYGLFSQVYGIAHSLLDAFVHDRVLSWKSTVTFYVDEKRCASRSFECLFRPITTCDDRPDLIISIKERVRNSCVYEFPQRRLHEQPFILANQSQWEDAIPKLITKAGLDVFERPDLFNAHFFIREALRFATRPNEHLIKSTELLLETDLRPPREWKPLGHIPRVVAVHLRAGDDKRGHTGVLEPKSYVELLRAIPSYSAVNTVFFSSDDPKSQEQFLHELRNASSKAKCKAPDVLFIPQSRFASLASLYKDPLKDKAESEKDAKQATSLKDISDEGATQTTRATQTNLDTGLLLMSQAFIFAHCDAAIGLFASNVALAMAMYMSALRFSKDAIPTLDVGGSPLPSCSQFNEYPLRFMRHPALYGE